MPNRNASQKLFLFLRPNARLPHSPCEMTSIAKHCSVDLYRSLIKVKTATLFKKAIAFLNNVAVCSLVAVPCTHINSA